VKKITRVLSDTRVPGYLPGTRVTGIKTGTRVPGYPFRALLTATMMARTAITDSAMIAAKDEESTVFFSTSNVAQLK